MDCCELLDDFLARDLESERLARFERHLLSCDACRQSVAENEHLDRMLREAVGRSPAMPALVTLHVRGRARAIAWRRIAALCAALAASVAFVWLISRPAPPRDERATARIVEPATPDHVAVRFRSADVIVVPEPFDSPNVTFLWVHPALTSNSERSMP